MELKLNVTNLVDTLLIALKDNNVTILMGLLLILNVLKKHVIWQLD